MTIKLSKLSDEENLNGLRTREKASNLALDRELEVYMTSYQSRHLLAHYMAVWIKLATELNEKEYRAKMRQIKKESDILDREQYNRMMLEEINA
jgi:hypothetical protein